MISQKVGASGPSGRPTIPALLLVIGIAAASACASDAESGSSPQIAVTDDAGRTVELPEPPRRILSLVPSATETLVALGAADRLVGRTDFDTLSAVASLPSVGGGLEPNLERVVSLEPELVIRFAGPSDRNTPSRLDDLGIRHLAVRPDGVDDVRRIVGLLGEVVGAETRAEALLAAMEEDLDEVARSVRGLPRPRVAFVLPGSPPWAAGPATFVDQLIEIAGGENVFSDLGQLYGPVSREAFVAREIDLILTSSPEEFPSLPPEIPIHRVPAWVETPGLDLGESARLLAGILHPEAAS